MSIKGVFSAIADQYTLASSVSTSYLVKIYWLWRIFFIPLALIYSLALSGIALCFRLFFVFDFISSIVDGLRKGILNFLNRKKNGIRYSFFGFLFNPPMMVLVAPLFLICAILPKISSQIDMDDYGEVEDVGEGGIFTEMKEVCFGAVENIIDYVKGTHMLFIPFLSMVAVIYVPFLALLTVCFYILII